MYLYVSQDSFRPQWRLIQAEYSGVNLIISRNKYYVEETGTSLLLYVSVCVFRYVCMYVCVYVSSTLCVGNVKASPGALGVYYKVAREKEPIVTPLKRLGLEHDRFSNHQIRQVRDDGF